MLASKFYPNLYFLHSLHWWDWEEGVICCALSLSVGCVHPTYWSFGEPSCIAGCIIFCIIAFFPIIYWSFREPSCIIFLAISLQVALCSALYYSSLHILVIQYSIFLAISLQVAFFSGYPPNIDGVACTYWSFRELHWQSNGSPHREE